MWQIKDNSARKFPETGRLVICAAALTLCLIQTAASDPLEMPSVVKADKDRGLFNISGEYGTYGELYTISGRDNRRPPSTGRVFFKPTISIAENFTVNFNLFLSTEGRGTRQDINQIDINPEWGWGEAHLVDFTESYSTYTLNGIKIRGASLHLTPGFFRASIISGITQTKVSSSNANIVYRRNLNGGKIGFGDAGGSYFDIIVLSTRDDFQPTEIAIPDTTIIEDTTGQTGNQNPESITPQENLAGALVTNLTFAEKKLTWKNELGGSAITRDRRSAEWEQEGYPDFLKNIFTPRLSSSFDIAFSSDIKFNIDKYNIAASYQYVGPGYVSLGLASQTQDKQAMKLSLNRRLGAGAFKIDLSRQNDNLINQKSYTTYRNMLNSGFMFKPMAIWNSNFNITFISMDNSAADRSVSIDFTSWVFRLNNSLAFKRKLGLTGMSLDYSFQTAGDTNPARIGSELRSHTATARASYNIREGINIAPSINIVGNRQAAAGWTITKSFATALNVLSMKKRLNSGVQLGISFDRSTTSLKSGLRTSYKLTSTATINLQLELRDIQTDSESGGFNEFTSRLTITNRF